jgi:AcrR family transcriptional regulator
VSAPTGRRERKKQLTRQAISDVATRLFLERGFDAVTVAEIAAAADVAVQTVFNHFPAKEDLFFDDRLWVVGPAEAVAGAPGEPVDEVLRSHYRTTLAALRAKDYLPTYARFQHTVAASPALRARRAELVTEMQNLLAGALAGGQPGWRHRLVAARFTAVRQVLDAELLRRLDEHPDAPDAVLDGLAAVLDEAFAGLDPD